MLIRNTPFPVKLYVQSGLFGVEIEQLRHPQAQQNTCKIGENKNQIESKQESRVA